MGLSHRGELGLAGPRDESVLARFRDPPHDAGALSRCLPLAVNDFGEAPSQVPVVIDPRISQVLEGQGPQSRESARDVEITRGDAP